MRIYIPSKGRAHAITTHRLLNVRDIPYHIVVDNEDERAAYLANPGIADERILVSGQSSLVATRQWILDRTPLGEWVMMMDDDIRCFYALEEPWYQQDEYVLTDSAEDRAVWRPRFRHVLHADEFLAHAEEDMWLAEQLGANLVGYDQTENYLFRERRYRMVEYVSFDTFITRRTDADFDLSLESIDDFYFTALHLELDGKVLVNHWIRPNATHYKPGGLGPKDYERAMKRLRDCERIMARWPGLFRLKRLRPSDRVPHPDLALRIHHLSELETWRDGLASARERAAAPVGMVY